MKIEPIDKEQLIKLIKLIRITEFKISEDTSLLDLSSLSERQHQVNSEGDFLITIKGHVEDLQEL